MTINELFNQFNEIVKMPFSYLLSPDKRVFILYLFTSLLLAYTVYAKSGLKKSFLAYLFKKQIWIGKSAIIDYGFIFFNSLIKVFFIAPMLVYALYLTLFISEYLTSQFGISKLNWSVTTLLATYTLTIIVVNDFMSFIVHYLMHKIPFLWQFHKIHHSATVLNPFTQYRIHPVELIINNVRGIFVKGCLTGIFIYLANGQVSLITFLGINIFNFIFLAFGSNLRHSHVQFKYYNFLEYIFISPFQHQIHHSNKKEHYDKNMGSRFAIWDWIFGTLVRSEKVVQLRFGLGKSEDNNYDSFLKNLINPFINFLKYLK
jgi:sterol desaturase/sphingolipid hydroxylase (fatty acid hydroxylase superfamily)